MSHTAKGLAPAVESLMTEETERVENEARQAALPDILAPVVDGGGEAAAQSGPRRPGRPTGSRNRSTEEWRRYILSNYRSPLVFLAETYCRPVDQLAAELGCKKQEAFKVQVAAAKEALPYLHQRQPLAVEVGGQGLVNLVIQTGEEAPETVPGSGAMVIEGRILDASEMPTKSEGYDDGSDEV